MKLGIIISTNDPETIFNGLRLGNFALSKGDHVNVFLLGKGVELDKIHDEQFNVHEQASSVLKAGGKIMACGTCMKIRNQASSEVCPISTMKDLHELIEGSDKVVSL